MILVNGILCILPLVFEKNLKNCKERLTRAPKMWFCKGRVKCFLPHY